MFGILKKKLSNFGDKLKRNVKEKEEGQITQETKEPITPEETKTTQIQKEPPKTEAKIKQKEVPIEKKETPITEEKIPQQKQVNKEDLVLEEIRKEIEKEEKEKPVSEKSGALELEKEKIQKEEQLLIEEPLKEKTETAKEIPEEKKTVKKDFEKKEPTKKIGKKRALDFIEDELEEEKDTEMEMLKETNREKPRDIEIKKTGEDKRELKAKISKTGKLKGLIKRSIEISENDLEALMWELELSLIESDVEQETAHTLIKGIKEKLVGKNVSIKTIDQELQNAIKKILTEMMTTKKINLLEEIKKAEKPYKILMLGPNGAGKTTHIAKLTNYFKKNNLSVVWAAADTFRSGAIDQLQEHATKLDIKVIKQQYGADPAAVAFDAIKSAKASGSDVVIIDTAGRQETNKNLMEELKKIQRVVQPNIKIYVGEAYVGQGLIDQAGEFDSVLGIDGFILSKIDTDAKGGTSISLLYKLKKPILYVGTGQGYDDLEEFTPKFILDRII